MVAPSPLDSFMQDLLNQRNGPTSVEIFDDTPKSANYLSLRVQQKMSRGLQSMPTISTSRPLKMQPVSTSISSGADSIRGLNESTRAQSMPSMGERKSSLERWGEREHQPRARQTNQVWSVALPPSHPTRRSSVDRNSFLLAHNGEADSLFSAVSTTSTSSSEDANGCDSPCIMRTTSLKRQLPAYAVALEQVRQKYASQTSLKNVAPADAPCVPLRRKSVDQPEALHLSQI